MSVDSNKDPVHGLVSIIVPVYNCKAYFPACVRSVATQTYRNLELLLVDDGSTDGSGGLCDQYAQTDHRIRVAHQANGGPAAARNTGLRQSRGEFLFFLDADDTIEAGAIEQLVANQGQWGADFVIGDFVKVRNATREPRNDIRLPASQLMHGHELVAAARSYLRKPNKHLLFAYSWGRLFKSSIIKTNGIAFDPALRTFEDVCFNYAYLRHVKTVSFLRAELYEHRVYDTYTSATMSIGSDTKSMLGFTAALAAIEVFLGDKISRTDLKREIGHARVTLTIIQLVRICGQYDADRRNSIDRGLREALRDEDLRRALPYYSPAKGESRVLPVLIRARLLKPVVWVCRYKAHRRYGQSAPCKVQAGELVLAAKVLN